MNTNETVACAYCKRKYPRAFTKCPYCKQKPKPPKVNK